jgi:hypothetical protein
MSDGGQYNYDFGYGDSEQGQGEVSSGNATSGTDLSSIFGGTGTGSNIVSRFLSGSATGGDKALATLGFGIAALASSLRNKPPEVKMPVYKEAPVYNRALTAPMLPPQPAAQKSASGQNIYQPMVGLPLFFNPNPFQFNPTEAAKRYGPTQAEIAAGQQGYSQGLERLYQSLGQQPAIQFNTTGTDTTAGGNSTVTGGTDTSGGGLAYGGSVDDLMVGYAEGGDVISEGRYLRGPGDGMSDDIYAYIEGGMAGKDQPARLARNEFVIPADVVSDLGNGSSDAGADALYEMMERVRKARHGTKEQPPAVKPEKVMPA